MRGENKTKHQDSTNVTAHPSSSSKLWLVSGCALMAEVLPNQYVVLVFAKIVGRRRHSVEKAISLAEGRFVFSGFYFICPPWLTASAARAVCRCGRRHCPRCCGRVSTPR